MEGKDPGAERLRFLVRVVTRQAHYLEQTHQRLFAGAALTQAALNKLDNDPEFAERVEAFVSCFSRLQDSLGDKLLPTLLAYAGEPPRTVVEIKQHRFCNFSLILSPPLAPVQSIVR